VPCGPICPAWWWTGGSVSPCGRLEIDVSGLDDVLRRTDGVTASFVKELIRRAAVGAAERTIGSGAAEREVGPGQLSVSAADLTAALDELLDQRNAMTRILLGSGGQSGGTGPSTGPQQFIPLFP